MAFATGYFGRLSSQHVRHSSCCVYRDGCRRVIVHQVHRGGVTAGVPVVGAAAASLNDVVISLQRATNVWQVVDIVRQNRATLRAQHVAPSLERISRWMLRPEQPTSTLDALEEEILRLMVWPTLMQALDDSEDDDGESGDSDQSSPPDCGRKNLQSSGEKLATHVIATLHAAALLFPGRVERGGRNNVRVIVPGRHLRKRSAAARLRKVGKYLEQRQHEWCDDTVLVSKLWWAWTCLGFKDIMPKGIDAHMRSLPFELHPWLLHDRHHEFSVAQLRTEVHLKHDTILVNGKLVKELRETAWMSTSRSFEYSGKTMQPQPFSTTVEWVRQVLKTELGIEFDGCLVNFYEDGKVAMSYHQDPDMGTIWEHDTCVVSIGATRIFSARRIQDPSRSGPARLKGEPDRYEFFVRDGDVLHMKFGCQDSFEHCVKKMKEASSAGPRISLVFKKAI